MVLHRVAEAVQAGVAQVVVLTGEAGAGKSRLAAEILGSLGEPWRVEVARRAGSDRNL